MMLPNLKLIHIQDPVFASQTFQSNDLSYNEALQNIYKVKEYFLYKLLYFTFHQYFIHKISVTPH